MDGIRELLADICLVGAAVFSVAWVVFVNRGRLAQAGADAGSKLARAQELGITIWDESDLNRLIENAGNVDETK